MEFAKPKPENAAAAAVRPTAEPARPCDRRRVPREELKSLRDKERRDDHFQSPERRMQLERVERMRGNTIEPPTMST